MTPRAMISETARLASSMSLNGATRVLTASGSGVSLTMILVATPRVPSEPMKRPRRS